MNPTSTKQPNNAPPYSYLQILTNRGGQSLFEHHIGVPLNSAIVSKPRLSKKFTYSNLQVNKIEKALQILQTHQDCELPVQLAVCIYVRSLMGCDLNVDYIRILYDTTLKT